MRSLSIHWTCRFDSLEWDNILHAAARIRNLKVRPRGIISQAGLSSEKGSKNKRGGENHYFRNTGPINKFDHARR
jgi:hypothetical protein